MGKSKRNILAIAEQSTTPPDELNEDQSIARVVKIEGNHRYTCELPSKKPILVELEDRFRSTIWIKRGGYVLVDLTFSEERKGSRVIGEIVNVIRDEKDWRKQPYWPKEFARSAYPEDSEDESNAGKMPPSDSEDEED